MLVEQEQQLLIACARYNNVIR